MTRVNIQDAKTHLSRYLDQVENGEVVVVCRHNRPIAEIRAIETATDKPIRVPGLLKGQIHWKSGAFDLMTDDELAGSNGASVFPHRP